MVAGEQKQTVECRATAKERQPEASRGKADANKRTTAAASNRTDREDGGGDQKQTVHSRAAAMDRQPTAPRDTADVDERTTAAASNRTDGKEFGGEY